MCEYVWYIHIYMYAGGLYTIQQNTHFCTCYNRAGWGGILAFIANAWFTSRCLALPHARQATLAARCLALPRIRLATLAARSLWVPHIRHATLAARSLGIFTQPINWWKRPKQYFATFDPFNGDGTNKRICSPARPSTSSNCLDGTSKKQKNKPKLGNAVHGKVKLVQKMTFRCGGNNIFSWKSGRLKVHTER